MAFAQPPLSRTRDLAALRCLASELSQGFEGMTLDLDAKQELVSVWSIPVTFPPTVVDPNRFVQELAHRGLRLATTLSPPYTGYRYALRVPKTKPPRRWRVVPALFVVGVALAAGSNDVQDAALAALAALRLGLDSIRGYI